jgi:hypothetical protein
MEIVRANCPIPPQSGVFYWEVTIISKGRDGMTEAASYRGKDTLPLASATKQSLLTVCLAGTIRVTDIMETTGIVSLAVGLERVTDLRLLRVMLLAVGLTLGRRLGSILRTGCI